MAGNKEYTPASRLATPPSLLTAVFYCNRFGRLFRSWIDGGEELCNQRNIRTPEPSSLWRLRCGHEPDHRVLEPRRRADSWAQIGRCGWPHVLRGLPKPSRAGFDPGLHRRLSGNPDRKTRECSPNISRPNALCIRLTKARHSYPVDYSRQRKWRLGLFGAPVP